MGFSLFSDTPKINIPQSRSGFGSDVQEKLGQFMTIHDTSFSENSCAEERSATALHYRSLPSGELTWQWKITIFNGKIHYKWPFSIAMLVHQRVLYFNIFQSSQNATKPNSKETSIQTPLAEFQGRVHSQPLDSGAQIITDVWRADVSQAIYPFRSVWLMT